MNPPDRFDEDAKREEEDCPDCQYTEGHAYDCPSDPDGLRLRIGAGPTDGDTMTDKTRAAGPIRVPLTLFPAGRRREIAKASQVRVDAYPNSRMRTDDEDARREG